MRGGLAGAFLLLAGTVMSGCMDGPVASRSTDAPTALPAQLLADVLAKVEVPLQLTAATADFDVADVQVPSGLTTVRFEFERRHTSAASLSDSCRLVRDGQVIQETRFSDAGRVDVGGEPARCTIGLYPAEPGTYPAVYSVAGPAPPGTHDIHLRAEASLPTWSGGHPTPRDESGR